MTMDMERERAHQAWRHAERLKRLSDRLVGIGPIGIGLDGITAWIPGVNLIYGVGAGAFMIHHGLRAKASPATLGRMGLYILLDNLPDTIPIPGISLIGSAIDMLFPGHLMAAKALQKDIEARHGLPAEEAAKRKKDRFNGGSWFNRRKAISDDVIEGKVIR
jgi:hypothetical protein